MSHIKRKLLIELSTLIHSWHFMMLLLKVKTTKKVWKAACPNLFVTKHGKYLECIAPRFKSLQNTSKPFDQLTLKSFRRMERNVKKIKPFFTNTSNCHLFCWWLTVKAVWGFVTWKLNCCIFRLSSHYKMYLKPLNVNVVSKRYFSITLNIHDQISNRLKFRASSGLCRHGLIRLTVLAT